MMSHTCVEGQVSFSTERGGSSSGEVLYVARYHWGHEVTAEQLEEALASHGADIGVISGVILKFILCDQEVPEFVGCVRPLGFVKKFNTHQLVEFGWNLCAPENTESCSKLVVHGKSKEPISIAIYENCKVKEWTFNYYSTRTFEITFADDR